MSLPYFCDIWPKKEFRGKKQADTSIPAISPLKESRVQGGAGLSPSLSPALQVLIAEWKGFTMRSNQMNNAGRGYICPPPHAAVSMHEVTFFYASLTPPQAPCLGPRTGGGEWG